MSKSCKRSGFTKFLLGAAIGATAGLLFAPKKGSETRKDLKNKFDELVKKTKEIDANEVKAMIESKVDEIKKELASLDKEKVLSIAKEKGAKIKAKSEELVVLAKEKGSVAVQKIANEAREKTIAVVKEVLVKLEKSNSVTKEKK